MFISPETSPSVARSGRLPGDLAMWLFILAELAVFGILIVSFLVAQAIQAPLFHAGRRVLDASMGLALTLSLLTSGWLAAWALSRVRNHRQGATALFGLAWIAAAGYVVLKLREYTHLVSGGWGLEYDTFFTLYWLLTGFHFLHVLLGMLILLWLAWHSRTRDPGHVQLATMESGVLYWHMVDLVWVVLFPVVYLLE